MQHFLLYLIAHSDLSTLTHAGWQRKGTISLGFLFPHFGFQFSNLKQPPTSPNAEPRMTLSTLSLSLPSLPKLQGYFLQEVFLTLGCICFTQLVQQTWRLILRKHVTFVHLILITRI